MTNAIKAEPLSRPYGLIAARAVYGIAAILFGLNLLIWHQFNAWETANVVHGSALRELLLYVMAIAQIAGGIGLQTRETSTLGSALLLIAYSVFAALHLPSVLMHPLVYQGWGGFFEQMALVAAALILLPRASTAAFGLAIFRLCALSFMLYQAFYLPQTANLVPEWTPLGQAFWAIATTVAFGLAAISLAVRYMDVAAARLITLMLVVFQFMIWIPALFAKPNSHTIWAANAENLGIAASAWLVADCLARGKSKITSA